MDVNTDLLWALWKCISKIFSATGVILIGASITPPGDFVRENDNYFMKQWRWIKEFPTRDTLASPVIINPVFLYLGLFLSIFGILLS